MSFYDPSTSSDDNSSSEWGCVSHSLVKGDGDDDSIDEECQSVDPVQLDKQEKSAVKTSTWSSSLPSMAHT